MRLNDPTLLKRQALIGGTWTDTEPRFGVFDPADASLLAELPDLRAVHAHSAVAAATEAFPAWAARPARERAAILRRWAELLRDNQTDLALILTREQGKPLSEAAREIVHAAGYLDWFAEEAKRVYGETVPAPRGHQRILVLRQPIGVAAAITPSNFPASTLARKAAAALAAGCPVVAKPSELAPLTALAMGELGLRAGLPPGVLSLLTTTAANEVGAALCASPAVRQLGFTGSTAVGKQLMRQCADTVKKLSLELGGNAPFIVFEDADLDAAVAGALASRFRNAGQTCVSANRLLVQAPLYDAFAARLAAAVAALRVGPGTDARTQIGPLISGQAVEALQRRVDAAKRAGARALTGARRLGGNYYAPTVLTEVRPDMALAREELFGPAAAILRFEDETEALAMANDTEAGLAAYLYTRDLSRALRCGEALEAGMVGINEGVISSEAAPFGGVKQSGLGREGSRHGIDEYLELKYMMIGSL